MKFKMTISNKDEKFFDQETNLATLGRGSYTGTIDISVVWGRNVNLLIGRFCSLASGLFFLIGGNHSMKSVTTSPIDRGRIVRGVFGEVRPNLRPVPDVRMNPRQVIVGNDVWIGHSVTIMGGVKIGNGAVIGAKSVVAKNIPPYAIAVGNPARGDD